ncbi:MAG: 16S rRNA (guanine(966)-N(2))-methyltransferase RsmD [Chloroflexota bacterium]
MSGARKSGPATGGMRVIAGEARGIPLRGPRGAATRPTAARLREALFSMLDAADVDFAQVLDLYAGSGALGIEALSRSDGDATFVESDPHAIEAIHENLARTHLQDRGRVIAARVERWHAPEGTAYTLVVADPPYHDAAAWDAIDRAVQNALAPDAVLVVEHEAHTAPPETLAGRPLWRDRRQGAGSVALYRLTGEGVL